MSAISTPWGAIAPGALLAGIAASGPVVALWIIGPLLLHAVVTPTDFNGNGLWFGLMVLLWGLPISLCVGLVMATLPALLSTTILTMIGRYARWTRGYWLWALIGASEAAVAARLLQTSPPAELAPFVVAGTICALLCRRGVSWPAPAPGPTAPARPVDGAPRRGEARGGEVGCR